MSISPLHVIVILALGVLIFGKNLPAVAKQVGLGLMEFKRGLSDLNGVSKNRSSKVSETSSFSFSDQSDSTEKHDLLGAKFEPPLSS